MTFKTKQKTKKKKEKGNSITCTLSESSIPVFEDSNFFLNYRAFFLYVLIQFYEF